MTRVRRAGLLLWQSPTLMTWMSLAIRMGGLVLLLPLVLTHLSTAEVLVWQMLMTIVAMVSWIDFGFSQTFARIIAFARGGGTVRDLEATMPVEARVEVGEAEGARPIDIAAVLGTQRAIYRRIVAVAAIVGGALGTAALIGPVATLPSPSTGWAVWAVSAAAALFTLLNVANVAIITGFDQIARTRRIEAFVSAAQLLSTSLAVVLGGDLLAIVACYSAWTVLLFLLNARLARAVRPPEAKGAAPLDRDLLRLIWPAAWRSGIGIFMSAGIIQGSGLVYAQFASVAEAASYLLAIRLMSALSALSQAPFYTKLPMLAKLRAEGNRDETLRLAIRGMRLSHWTFVLGALAIAAAGNLVLSAVESSVLLPGELLMGMLVLAFFAERYSSMHVQLYTLTNHVVWHIANGVTGALMVILCLLIWPLLGPSAMPAAMLGAYGGFCAWYASVRSLRSLEADRRLDLRTMAGPGLALILILGLTTTVAAR